MAQLEVAMNNGIRLWLRTWRSSDGINTAKHVSFKFSPVGWAHHHRIGGLVHALRREHQGVAATSCGRRDRAARLSTERHRPARYRLTNLCHPLCHPEYFHNRCDLVDWVSWRSNGNAGAGPG